MLNFMDPPKPALSDASWAILSEFPNDAEEILFAFERGLDALIDPKLGFVMSCAMTSITKEIAARYKYIVIEADSGLTLFY